uniref:Ovule protein n=1 Tax=Strongyloides papillosus TaxID=174720 RepID=A0A0N5BR92_STREA
MEYSVHQKDSTDRIYERNGQSRHHRSRDNWLLVKSGKSYVNNKDGRVARQYKRRNGICNEEPELNRGVIRDPRKPTDYKGSGPNCGLWPVTFKKVCLITNFHFIYYLD